MESKLRKEEENKFLSLLTLLLHSQNELYSERRSLKGDRLVLFPSDTTVDT